MRSLGKPATAFSRPCPRVVTLARECLRYFLYVSFAALYVSVSGSYSVLLNKSINYPLARGLGYYLYTGSCGRTVTPPAVPIYLGVVGTVCAMPRSTRLCAGRLGAWTGPDCECPRKASQTFFGGSVGVSPRTYLVLSIQPFLHSTPHCPALA